jgi:molybdopterin-binding protein
VIDGALPARPNGRNGGSRLGRISKKLRLARFLPASLTVEGAAMRISARNQIKGKIVEVKKGATTAHVRIEVANGLVITSSITNEAVEELGLKVGGSASAIIKASDVMVAVG